MLIIAWLDPPCFSEVKRLAVQKADLARAVVELDLETTTAAPQLPEVVADADALEDAVRALAADVRSYDLRTKELRKAVASVSSSPKCVHFPAALFFFKKGKH